MTRSHSDFGVCNAATIAAVLALAAFALVTVKAAPRNSTASPKPDAAASREAFLQVYKVFTSPRCQNCHPSGDAPLQGDDSHPHLQNVKRGKDGHGVYGMHCDTCHQSANLTGDHMPPGNPKWALPPPEHKMVFVGRTPAQLCRQLKDPKQNGGRSLQQLFEHVSSDNLVGWGWDPGDGRTLPPLNRADTSAQMKVWIDGGAACPE
jgi:mono/diheme cytochrome c family protein